MKKHSKLPTLVCVVGARPNFMKIAPIMAALKKHHEKVRPYLVHTGQHYDESMKKTFFHQLGIPEPDIDLEVGSGTHAVQTADVMRNFEPVLDREKPFAVLVVGDVNSTIACGLVAVKKQIPLIHVEAGLRSNDRQMPEEINRVLTDQISDLLFTTEQEAEANLTREGVGKERIHFAGNVMIDTLLANLEKSIPFSDTLNARAPEFADKFKEKNYALLTLHRPSNVDESEVLSRILKTVETIAESLPVIFPIHPRTKKMVKQFGFEAILENDKILCLPPLPYLEILGLMAKAKMVLTDSGGLQEESTALGVPCITLRENTERPITVMQGTNTIVGSDRKKILDCSDEIIKNGGKSGCIPDKWDGKAAERVVEVIFERYL